MQDPIAPGWYNKWFPKKEEEASAIEEEPAGKCTDTEGMKAESPADGHDVSTDKGNMT